MAELVEDGLIGVFVRYEDLFSVGEGLRDAFELLGGHLSVSSSADEDLAQGDGSVEVQVGLDVLVHDLHDLGQCLDSVPPQGLATEGSDELPLALHTVDVGTGGTSVSGIDQGFVAVEPLHVLAHTPLLGEQAVSYINPDPAHRVDDSLETLEIHDGVMVYGYVRVVLNRVDRLIDAVVVVGGVYLVLFSRLYLDEEIPGYREQLDVSCLRTTCTSMMVSVRLPISSLSGLVSTPSTSTLSGPSVSTGCPPNILSTQLLGEASTLPGWGGDAWVSLSIEAGPATSSTLTIKATRTTSNTHIHQRIRRVPWRSLV